MFILKSAKAISAENLLKNKLQIEKLKKRIDTITEDIIAEFTFYFPESIYYTKQNVRSKKLPDLSNLYELPQDCLQSTKIIENDTQIVSHGKSSREPINDNNYWLEIKLIKS
jgi:Holliday junction resolvase RusA-like endonuclease